MNQTESADNAPPVVLNAPVPTHAKDAPSLPPPEPTEPAHAQQAISSPPNQSDSVKDVTTTAYNVLQATTVTYAYQASLPLLTVNASAQEETTSTLNSNAFHASTTVPFVQVKKSALFVLLDSISKMVSALRDVTLDISFQESSVKNVKKDVNSVKELEPAASVKPEDSPSTDYAISTVPKGQSPILPTTPAYPVTPHARLVSNTQANV